MGSHCLLREGDSSSPLQQKLRKKPARRGKEEKGGGGGGSCERISPQKGKGEKHSHNTDKERKEGGGGKERKKETKQGAYVYPSVHGDVAQNSAEKKRINNKMTWRLEKQFVYVGEGKMAKMTAIGPLWSANKKKRSAKRPNRRMDFAQT